MKNLLVGIFLLLAPIMNGQAVHYRIETGKPQQIMEHFSSSDAWSTQFVGLWPQEKQNQMADWLFSMETDSKGQPKGIGLPLWRFYVGAGSTEQGEESQIGSVWTRAECFLQADGTYNWDKMKGQRNFIKLAKERGVNQFLAFLNSPPVNFTQNGLATNTGRDGTFNMKADCYVKYAAYLADIIEGVEKHDGIKFNYICPFNEPDGHWNWLGPKQEGTPATNREIAKTVRLISKEFVKRKIDTQILISESSDYRCMFDNHMTDWQRGHQIQTFFSPDSTATYLGDTPNVPRLMVGHSYWTNTPLKSLHDIRCQLRDTLDKYKVDFWQTELCIMHNDKEIGGIPGFDSTMKTALYVARVIHHDIVFAHAKSWQWWRTFGEKNRNALVRIFPDSTLLDGEIADTKLLWAIGNYSRFVRPGAVRLAVSAFDKNGRLIHEGDTEQTGLMCSSFRNTDGSKVLVVLNYGKQDRTFLLDQDVVSREMWQQYRTSDREGESLKPVGRVENGKMVCIPARSMVTLVSSGEK
jgi:glycoside hydrolase family 5, candidate beta-glycosidase